MLASSGQVVVKVLGRLNRQAERQANEVLKVGTGRLSVRQVSSQAGRQAVRVLIAQAWRQNQNQSCGDGDIEVGKQGNRRQCDVGDEWLADCLAHQSLANTIPTLGRDSSGLAAGKGWAAASTSPLVPSSSSLGSSTLEYPHYPRAVTDLYFSRVNNMVMSLVLTLAGCPVLWSH